MPGEPDWPVGGYAGIGDEAAPDLAGQLAVITALGWSAVELRNVDGTALADLDASRFGEVARAVRAAGLRVVCLDSRIGNWARSVAEPFEQDVTELRTLLGRCAELGCRYVRIMSYPNAGLPEPLWRREVLDRVSRLAELAERAGITLLHENCAGWAGASAERTLWLLHAVDSPALRVLFDVGNGISAGYVAFDLLDELVAAVAHVHVKDAVGAGSTTTYTVPGAGHARVADCLRRLRTAGYRGALSIEPHLTFQPHRGEAAGTGSADGFLAAGDRLMRLVREQVLTTGPAAMPE